MNKIKIENVNNFIQLVELYREIIDQQQTTHTVIHIQELDYLKDRVKQLLDNVEIIETK